MSLLLQRRWLNPRFVHPHVCVHSRQLISGISQVFAVLCLNFITGVVVDQFSSTEAEYFVSAVFLVCAGVEE